MYEHLNAALIGGPFARSLWRAGRGALLDVGPHCLDLLTTALGAARSIEAITARDITHMRLRHDSGLVSHSMLSGHIRSVSQVSMRLVGPDGTLSCDLTTPDEQLLNTIRTEFVATVAGAPHPCDVHRGVQLQRWIDAAQSSARRDGDAVAV